MDNGISRLQNIGGRNSFRSSRMRVENGDEVESVEVDPIKGVELFIRIHHESYWTLRLVQNPDHFLSPCLFACQYAAGFERYVLINIRNHLLQKRFAQC